jgi:hypothetical protein
VLKAMMRSAVIDADDLCWELMLMMKYFDEPCTYAEYQIGDTIHQLTSEEGTFSQVFAQDILEDIGRRELLLTLKVSENHPEWLKVKVVNDEGAGGMRGMYVHNSSDKKLNNFEVFYSMKDFKQFLRDGFNYNSQEPEEDGYGTDYVYLSGSQKDEQPMKLQCWGSGLKHKAFIKLVVANIMDSEFRSVKLVMHSGNYIKGVFKSFENEESDEEEESEEEENSD